MPLAGGWTVHTSMDADAQKVFDDALKGLVGVKYEAIAYATQVVAGMNYSFVCKGTIVVPDAPESFYEVRVLVPAGADKPCLTGIHNILRPYCN